jgi:hypothetical protein
MLRVAIPPLHERLGFVPYSVSGQPVSVDIRNVQKLRVAELAIVVVVHRHDLALVDQRPVAGRRE